MQRYLTSLILALTITACGEPIDDGGGGDDDPPPPRCGDMIKNGEEACDNGTTNTATCDSDCTAVACGDRLVNEAAGERCDDGNTASGDGCSSTCQLERGE